jgi:hypothetical protein
MNALEFREPEGRSAARIVLLGNLGSFDEAVSLAAQRGLRLPTLRDFIKAIDRNKNFQEKVAGNWYWLSDTMGLQIKGFCGIDYRKGTLYECEGWKTLEKKYVAYATDGCGPIGIKFMGDDGNSFIAVNADEGLRRMPMNIAMADYNYLIGRGADSIRRLKRNMRQG